MGFYLRVITFLCDPFCAAARIIPRKGLKPAPETASGNGRRNRGGLWKGGIGDEGEDRGGCGRHWASLNELIESEREGASGRTSGCEREAPPQYENKQILNPPPGQGQIQGQIRSIAESFISWPKMASNKPSLKCLLVRDLCITCTCKRFSDVSLMTYTNEKYSLYRNQLQFDKLHQSFYSSEDSIWRQTNYSAQERVYRLDNVHSLNHTR